MYVFDVFGLMWRLEDNFEKSILSFHLYVGPGIELRASGLFGKHL